MFANRRSTAAPVKSQALVAVEFERKPKKPQIAATKPNQVLLSTQKISLKKEVTAIRPPSKPSKVVKLAPKFSARTLGVNQKGKVNDQNQK